MNTSELLGIPAEASPPPPTVSTSPQGSALTVSIVTETYPPEVNGVASTIARFVHGLHELGHDITLFRPRQSSLDLPKNRERLKEILVSGIPIPTYRDLRLGLPRKRMLVRHWQAHRPDLVHIVTEGPLGWSALEAAKSLGIPVCSDFRTNFDAYSSHYGLDWLKHSIRWYMRYFHNRSSITMVPTLAMQRHLLGNGFERLQVVARGIDTQLFSPAKRSEALRRNWRLQSHERAVIFVGRLAPEKNLELTVEAFKAIRQVNPSTRMIWVGDGPERGALQASCADSLFVGVKTGESLAEHYASADIFLFSSTSETFGNVTLEAMASGLAVVAYDYAAAQQFIRSGQNGLLATMNDPQSFISQSCALATDKFDLRELRRQARATTLELSWQTVTRHLEASYRRLVRRPKLAAV